MHKRKDIVVSSYAPPVWCMLRGFRAGFHLDHIFNLESKSDLCVIREVTSDRGNASCCVLFPISKECW